MNQKSNRRGVVILAALLAIGNSVYGDAPIEFVGNATSFGGSELNAAECWGSAPTPDHDYRVSGGKHIIVGYGTTGSSTTFGFNGDSLILGIVGGTDGSLWHNGAPKLNLPLVLANGFYRTWGDGQYGGPAIARTLMGSATVESPESNRFIIYPCFTGGSTAYTVNLEMTISGAAGTGLLVSDKGLGSASRLNIKSSNPSYRGSIEVTGANLTLGFSSADSLGGTLDAFDDDALILKNGATLECLTSGVNLSASANRGISVDSTGGNIRVLSSNSLTLGWPVSGSGALAKTGEGTLVLSNSFTGVSLSLEAGRIAAASGKNISLPSLSISGGGFSVAANSGIVTANVASLDSGSKIPVTPSGVIAEGASVPFLRVPSGVLTLDDFSAEAGTGSYGAPFGKVTMATEGGSDTFSLLVLPVVTPSANGNSCADTAANWSDSREVHDNAAYLLRAESGSRTFYAKSGDSYSSAVEDDYVFPGEVMTFSGSVGGKISETKYGGICIRPMIFTANMRFYDASQVFFQNHTGNGETHVIRGTMEICTSSANTNWKGLYFNLGGNSTTAAVESVISGKGAMYISSSSKGAAVLKGDNSKYTGSIAVYSDSSDLDKHAVLRISDERNLGGNPATLNASALLLNHGSELHSVGSVVIDDPNRGVKFSGGNVFVRTDFGETTSFLSPLYGYSSKVRLAGGGTVLFGAKLTNSDKKYTNNVIVVDGRLKGARFDVLEGLGLAFEDGGGIAVDCVTDEGDLRSQYGMVMTNTTLTLNGATLPVRMDYAGVRPKSKVEYPVITVLASRADEIGGKIRFDKNVEDGAWALSRKDVTLGGVPCVVFGARCERGFVLTFR